MLNKTSIALSVLFALSLHSVEKECSIDPKQVISLAKQQVNHSDSTHTNCPSNMVEVDGDYCPEIEETCIKLDTSIHNVNGYPKCDEFAPTKCLSKTRNHMHFCIDKYEWPNQEGVKPQVMLSWNDMKFNCESQGKRLCKDVEWTFACEGEDILPYPYGLKRDSSACNIDKPQRIGFDASKMSMTPEIVAWLDQRVPSGAMANCVSPFGAHDMTGNADEATVNSSGRPYGNALKGGHWVGGARNRCRPSTIAHNESFVYYVSGGRCCK